MTTVIIAFVAMATLAQGHVVVTYPGWRGNNLIVNQTFPFGMQWIYPCGGTPPTTNRTNWPLDGSGAVAFEPGWFAGHERNLMYINLCLGAQPTNCSFPMLPVFEINGPNDQPYPGGVCLPKIPLPQGVKPKNGDLATIQIIQTQKHGASLYSCADITFTENKADIPPVTEKNCFNSTNIKVNSVRVVSDGGSGGSGSPSSPSSSTTTTSNVNPPPTSTSPGSNAPRAVSGGPLSGVSALLVLLHLI